MAGARWRWVRTASGPRVEVEGQGCASLSALRDSHPALFCDVMGGALGLGTAGYVSAEQ